MKKTIIATAILSTASFLSQAQQVDVAQAELHTRTLITAQMEGIDAKTLQRLNAQSHTTAIIEDTVYQQDSNGVWAAVGTTTTALAAGLLSGSSSSHASSSSDDWINLPQLDPSQPIETENNPTNPIIGSPEADNGRSVDKAAENMWIVSTHGEVDGYIIYESGEFTIRDSDKNIVGTWKPSPMNPIQGTPSLPIEDEVTPEADNGRSVDKAAENMWIVSTHGEVDGYIIYESGEFTIRDSDMNIVGTWKPSPMNPIQGTPSLPIEDEVTPEADNGRSVDKAAENMWIVSTHGEIDGYIIYESGEFTIRDSDMNIVGTWKPSPMNPIQGTPSLPIEDEATPEADNGRSVDKAAENMWIVSTHGEVDGYIIYESGEFTIRDSDMNIVGTWKPSPMNPIQGTPSLPIEDEATPEADNGRSVDKAAENMWIVSTHGEVDGYIIYESGEFTIRDSDMNIVGTWKPSPMNPIQGTPSLPIEDEATPEADNGRSVDKAAENMWIVSTHGEIDGYIIYESGEFTIRDSDKNIVGTWKPSPMNPIQGTPSLPIEDEATPEADNGRSVDKAAENMWIVSTHGEVDGYIIYESGEFTIRDSDKNIVGTWKPSPMNPIQGTPSLPIEDDATPEADNGRSVDKAAENMWIVSTHGEVDGYIILENGGVTIRDSERNEIGHWSPKNQIALNLSDVRNKVKSLTQEQRDTIKRHLRGRK